MSVILDHVLNTLAGFASPSGGVTVKASGIAQISLSTDGKVGIGTTSPAYPLDVVGIIRATEVVGKGTFTTGTSVSDNSANPALTITQEGTGLALRINDVTGDTTPFVVDSSGAVGIGTATPTSAKLHVMGGNIRTDSVIASDVTTGTAPFSIASTTVVPNLTTENSTKLNGFDWNSPGTIGATTANTGRFTSINISDFNLVGDVVSITEGGTGAASTSGALDNLLPAGEVPGYVLTTAGAGSYYWSVAGTGIGSGTRINTSRKYFIASAGQTILSGLDTYVIGSGQVRVYVNGIRLYPEDYTETSTTVVTLLDALALNDNVMVETDGFINYATIASSVAFTPTGNISATDVQSALVEMDIEKVPLNGTGATGTWNISISGSAATAGNVSGTVAVANGGTGAITAALARQGLGIGNGGAVNTASNAVVLDSSGKLPAVDASLLSNLSVKQIFPITATVAANAMTITLNPYSIDFRSTTLGSGAVTTVIVSSPITIVIPSGATLGTVNGVQSRLVVYAYNNAGTIELGVANAWGGDESYLGSTVAITSGSNSAATAYSTAARSNLAFRVVGFVESTQATAGTWATAPSTVQGAGGNALTSMASLGYGQTWQNVTGSRTFSTTYYNTTGRPISVSVYVNLINTGYLSGFVSGAQVSYDSNFTGNQNYASVYLIVPPGLNYSISATGGTVLTSWSELR